jgi:hypothetical protein
MDRNGAIALLERLIPQANEWQLVGIEEAITRIFSTNESVRNILDVLLLQYYAP